MAKTSLRQKIALIIFGVFLSFILIEAGLRIGGFVFTALQEWRNLHYLSEKGIYKIMCLGESTTALWGKDAYPYQLEEVLNKRNIGIKFQVINAGINGANSTRLLLFLERNLDKYKPDMVIAMMGVNDDFAYPPFNGISNSQIILFLKSFRVYKLIQFIWLHACSRINESTINHDYELLSIERKHLYEDGGNYLGEEFFRKKLELHPQDDWACTELAKIYCEQSRYLEAEKLFTEAIEINPHNEEPYLALEEVYLLKNISSKSEGLFKKAIEFNPKEDWAYLGLGKAYFTQGNFLEAEKLFKKAIEINPKNELTNANLAFLYEEMGKDDLARKYYKETTRLRQVHINPITVYNYHRLKVILDKRGIKLVCVQYPMAEMGLLKNIFAGQNGVLFVDNEKVFKAALKTSSYKEYFMDMFEGDFGHCTRKGNKLLAENIAEVLIKEYFSKNRYYNSYIVQKGAANVN